MRRKREQAITAKWLATELGGELAGASGDELLSGFATLADAGPGDLSFLTAAKHADQARASRAGLLMTPPDVELPERPCLRLKNVWCGVLSAMELWWPDEAPEPGRHPTAVVNESARLGEGVSVGPLAVIEAGAHLGDGVQVGAQCHVGRGVAIGDGTLLHPGVRLLEGVKLGRNVIIHSGAVLGSDGFKYEIIEGLPHKIPQVGRVVVEDEVELGANVCIDRAFTGETRIGHGTKIDNLTHIAHNCHIGPYNGMAAQVGVSGSVKTGEGCIFWGQVGLRDQLTIGRGVVVSAQSGVKDDLPDGAQVFGSPALPMSEAARLQAALRKLPELLRRLRRLEEKVG